jgi:hypothetical protein
MSIQKYAHNQDGWRHSQLYCNVVSKKPKINVVGSDVIVGRGTTSAIITSTVRKTVSGEAQTYGSWGEYAISASGSITGMSSGSGYANGATNPEFCPVSYLTITNAGDDRCTTTTPKGVYSYGGALPNVGSRFTNGTSKGTNPTIDVATIDADSPNDDNVFTGSGTIQVRASGDIGKGRYVVINARGANVVITEDIRYTGETLNRLSDIPQVVIIANNIYIQGNVGRVDAWLIANGTSGRIVTCSDVGVSNDDADKLNANVCGNRLTVNGPVAARHLLLYRTAGAGTGEQSGEPAEVFNLRPDAYLWATNLINGQGRLQTATTKDLPPRF